MKAKICILLASQFAVLGLAIAYSPPQIIEVNDNFGNIYDIEEQTSREGFARVRNHEQEIVVTDDTEVELCVTEVEHEEDSERSLTYHFFNYL